LLGFPAAECVVVEDVPAGIRSGKAAGASVIAFLSTVAAPELQAAGADFILNNCADIHLLRSSARLTLELTKPVNLKH
ncbi:MAG: hypothetical protein WB510_12215, partial [Candidatus Sulfotelmatobacter sp.]